tara:strand:+ start:837 stop:1130 length:294 start_codon:yes stop_codon:yes gene_type:complete
MLGGRGRTKRAVGSMRGKKISGLGALRQRKAARAARTPAAPRTPQTQARAARKMASRLGAVPTRGGRPTPRGRAAARQRRAMLKGARGRPRVQARRG